MGVIMYSFNLNSSPKMSYGVVLLCYKNTCLWFCNKKGAVFVSDHISGKLMIIQLKHSPKILMLRIEGLNSTLLKQKS